MKDVYIVRLSTGEELLCTIESDTDTHLTIKQPYVILPTAEGNIQFMKYMGYAEYTTLPVKVSNVMWVVNPNEEIIKQYNDMTGVIATPRRKIIT
jgi:hypothetical protein